MNAVEMSKVEIKPVAISTEMIHALHQGVQTNIKEGALPETHPTLWQDLIKMDAKEQKAFLTLVNGGATSPVGYGLGATEMHKEDAVISSLRVKHKLPIQTVKVGKRAMHKMTDGDIAYALFFREVQLEGEDEKARLKRIINLIDGLSRLYSNAPSEWQFESALLIAKNHDREAVKQTLKRWRKQL